MANDDDNGGAAGGLGTGDTFLDVVGAFLILLAVIQLSQTAPAVIAEVVANIQTRLSGVGGFAVAYTWLSVIASVFSLACLVGAVYAGIQLSRVRIAQRKELEELTEAAIGSQDTPNDRWEQVLSYAGSDDEELWRLAIIEADVLLDEMLSTMGHTEDTIGEKLKSVERSDFRTIDQAWEAHKLRNVIAHKGSTYDLTRRELDKAINNYREVFNEFSYI